MRERLSNAWTCFTARRLVQTAVSCHCRSWATRGPVLAELKPSTRREIVPFTAFLARVQKQPFSTFVFKFYSRIEFVESDVMSY